jgi:hypothetical protein
MPPEKRKPATGKVAGFLKFEPLPSKFEDQDNTPILPQLQAARIRDRFAVSWPVARAAAELAFGRAAA